MIMKTLLLSFLIGLVSAGSIPPPPSSTSIDRSRASSNGYYYTPTSHPSSSHHSSSDPSSSHHSSSYHSSSRPSSSRRHTSTYCPSSSDSDCDWCPDDCTTWCPDESTTWCPDDCRTTDFCCVTTTICKTIDNKPCWILIYPCPTETTSTITTTLTVSPTVAPTTAVAPVCTPCTSYVTQTTVPSLICTTFIFCDLADQSDNCVAQNNKLIEELVSDALRPGGQVFINGQLVVFKNTSGHVDGKSANGAQMIAWGAGSLFMALLGAIAVF